MIELDRYRGGQCNGRYTSRLHYLEDWIYDNERRGLVTNLTRSLGGVPMRGRYLNEMSKYWRDSRYLRNNPGLVPEMRQIEDRISSRTIYHIPKREVPGIESKIQDGDVICISGNGPEGFTEHVGLACRDRAGCSSLHARVEGRTAGHRRRAASQLSLPIQQICRNHGRPATGSFTVCVVAAGQCQVIGAKEQ